MLVTSWGCLRFSVSGYSLGVAVLGCRWPDQPRLPRDPPCAREYEGRIGYKCAAWPSGVKVASAGIFGRGECVCVALVVGFTE